MTFLPLLSFLYRGVKRGFSPTAGGAKAFGDLDLAIRRLPASPSTPNSSNGIQEAAATLGHVDCRPGSKIGGLAGLGEAACHHLVSGLAGPVARTGTGRPADGLANSGVAGPPVGGDGTWADRANPDALRPDFLKNGRSG
jgi:hypothetical protein